MTTNRTVINLPIREDDLTILVDLANSARLGNFGQIFSMRELEAFDRLVVDDDGQWQNEVEEGALS